MPKAVTSRSGSTTTAIIQYLLPQRGYVTVLAACLILYTGLQALSPQIIKRFIDDAVHSAAPHPPSHFWILAAIFLALTLLVQGLKILATFIGGRASWNATNRLRRDLIGHALKLDISFHKENTPGGLLERTDGDISTLSSFFSQFVFHTLANVLLLISILTILLIQDAHAGAILIAFSLLAIVVLRRSRHLGVEPFVAERQARTALAGLAGEQLAGLEDLRANGAGGYALRRFTGLSEKLTERGVHATKVAQVFGIIINNGVFICGYGLALTLGIWKFSQGLGTLGTLYVLLQYIAMLRAPIEALATQATGLQRAMASLERIHTLRTTAPSMEDGPGVPWEPSAHAVAFDDVSFGYDASSPVLRGVTFALEPGESIGILGRTGSGKSTIAKLLCRLHDPDSGRITIDGTDIRNSRRADLSDRIGLVTQEVEIFHASVRNNLTLFDPTLTDAAIEAALAQLGLRPWLDAQPHGLDTVLSGGLSGGEAQLLALGRMFLRDPGVIILDEASSRLDPLTEQFLEGALDRLVGMAGELRRRSAVIIAHRLRTVDRVDHVMILEDGRVVEFGRRRDLAADPNSRFAALKQSGMGEMLA